MLPRREIYGSLFHRIQATDRKVLGISEMIYEADGSYIYNQQRRLVTSKRYFQVSFS